MTRGGNGTSVRAVVDDSERGDLTRQFVPLRGRLAHTRLGAREIAQLARNPQCDRLLLHRAAQLDPATVVREVFGRHGAEKGSRLALATGTTFEHVLLQRGARVLFDLFAGSGRLPVGAETLVDVEGRYPDIDAESLSKREALTYKLLMRKLRGDRSAPAIIWHPRLTLPVRGIAGGVVHIEPDFLVAGPGEPFYRPGEVKSYKDRGPRTNATELVLARLQGALEVLALRETLRASAARADMTLTAAETNALVPMEFDLVLRARFGMRPRLRSLVVRREVTAMQTLIGDMHRRVLRVIEEHGTALRLDSIEGHRSVRNHLTESCRDHCPFAASCHDEARGAGLPILLGAEMEEAVSAVGTLPRLVALLNGSEAPRGPDERHVAGAFRDAQIRVSREVRRAG